MTTGAQSEIPPDTQVQSAILQGLYDISSIPVFNCGGACLWRDSFNATDINITECTVGFTAYEYLRAEANGSTFSFGKVTEMDIKRANWSWEDPMTKLHLVSNKTSNLPAFKISIIDLEALQAFFESTTFQSEFVSGNAKNNNPGLSAALNGDTDLTRAFDNMARGMTDYLRSGPNEKLAQGVRRESQIFVFIRWYWLIGPAALELAALIFAVYITPILTAFSLEFPSVVSDYAPGPTYHKAQISVGSYPFLLAQ
ncbi:hypothetical protein FocTR4_00011187 [Fusarium oxysporum f. sp. cubense]|uniref:Uncharacterized protein n=1 Tax=Fusarium oxysporum f. sp. cubense TaxID=61366 RepID=A0A5C6SEA4_FUSOC|nr:hypothetical protein FocTR4_00011187 [Fusarium oxysporum f. sp. cubense]